MKNWYCMREISDVELPRFPQGSTRFSVSAKKKKKSKLPLFFFFFYLNGFISFLTRDLNEATQCKEKAANNALYQEKKEEETKLAGEKRN